MALLPSEEIYFISLMFCLLCTLDHNWFLLSLSHPEYFISQVQYLLSASIHLVFDNID